MGHRYSSGADMTEEGAAGYTVRQRRADASILPAADHPETSQHTPLESRAMGKAEFRLTADGKAAVGSILYKGMLVEFLIDSADLEQVRQHKWHFTSGSYIATSSAAGGGATAGGEATASPKKRETYLHNFLMKPSEQQTVYHISKNGLDNRRANLRVVAKENPTAVATGPSKKRTTELPPLCGIRAEDIPKHVWYVQANGYHRDRFAIEFKTEKILWKSTSSKKVSLQEKLELAKTKLREFYAAHPHLDPKREEDAIATLTASFEAAVKESGPPPTPPGQHPAE